MNIGFSSAIFREIDLSNVFISTTSSLAPKLKFSFVSNWRNTAESFATPIRVHVSFNFTSDKCKYPSSGISPSWLGIGSPWGSIFGKSKKESNLLIKVSDSICSNCSAISCTSSQLYPSFSTKKTSQRRCFLIILSAIFWPISVSRTPWYFWYVTQPFQPFFATCPLQKQPYYLLILRWSLLIYLLLSLRKAYK